MYEALSLCDWFIYSSQQADEIRAINKKMRKLEPGANTLLRIHSW